MFSFNILVEMSVSCTDLLEAKLFNSYYKLGKFTLEKEKFRSSYFSSIKNILTLERSVRRISNSKSMLSHHFSDSPVHYRVIHL